MKKGQSGRKKEREGTKERCVVGRERQERKGGGESEGEKQLPALHTSMLYILLLFFLYAFFLHLKTRSLSPSVMSPQRRKGC